MLTNFIYDADLAGKPVSMRNVTCNGAESSLVDCSYDPGNQCDHRDDVGVSCSETCEPFLMFTCEFLSGWSGFPNRSANHECSTMC